MKLFLKSINLVCKMRKTVWKPSIERTVAWRALSQFRSLKIRSTAFLSYTKFVDRRNLRLYNCERVRRLMTEKREGERKETGLFRTNLIHQQWKYKRKSKLWTYCALISSIHIYLEISWYRVRIALVVNQMFLSAFLIYEYNICFPFRFCLLSAWLNLLLSGWYPELVFLTAVFST